MASVILSYLISLPSISLSPITITISILCIESIRTGFALGRGHEKKGQRASGAKDGTGPLCSRFGIGLSIPFPSIEFEMESIYLISNMNYFQSSKFIGVTLQ